MTRHFQAFAQPAFPAVERIMDQKKSRATALENAFFVNGVRLRVEIRNSNVRAHLAPIISRQSGVKLIYTFVHIRIYWSHCWADKNFALTSP